MKHTRETSRNIERHSNYEKLRKCRRRERKKNSQKTIPEKSAPSWYQERKKEGGNGQRSATLPSLISEANLFRENSNILDVDPPGPLLDIYSLINCYGARPQQRTIERERLWNVHRLRKGKMPAKKKMAKRFHFFSRARVKGSATTQFRRQFHCGRRKRGGHAVTRPFINHTHTHTHTHTLIVLCKPFSLRFSLDAGRRWRAKRRPAGCNRSRRVAMKDGRSYPEQVERERKKTKKKNTRKAPDWRPARPTLTQVTNVDHRFTKLTRAACRRPPLRRQHRPVEGHHGRHGRVVQRKRTRRLVGRRRQQIHNQDLQHTNSIRLDTADLVVKSPRPYRLRFAHNC